MRIYIFNIYVIQAVRHFFLYKMYQQTNLLYKLLIIKNNNIIFKKIYLYCISCFTCITCRDPPTHPLGCGTCRSSAQGEGQPCSEGSGTWTWPCTACTPP